MRPLGRRQVAVLRGAAAGTATMWHSGQGRMTVSIGQDRENPDDGLYPDSVLDTLFERDLISTSEVRHGFEIHLTAEGRDVLAALDG